MLEHWSKKGEFPIQFVPEKNFDDQTPIIVQSLNLFTPEIKAIFELIHLPSKDGQKPIETSMSKSNMEEAVDKLLSGLGMRGLMTMFGIRKTLGSADMLLPHKSDLVDKFNRPYIILSEEEKKTRKSIPKLSVGGKALSKHAHRSSEVPFQRSWTGLLG